MKMKKNQEDPPKKALDQLDLEEAKDEAEQFNFAESKERFTF
jgi:hypothetical protein